MLFMDRSRRLSLHLSIRIRFQALTLLIVMPVVADNLPTGIQFINAIPPGNHSLC